MKNQQIFIKRIIMAFLKVIESHLLLAPASKDKWASL